MWSIAALPLGIYVIVQDLNVPLIVQPQLFALFTLCSWAQEAIAQVVWGCVGCYVGGVCGVGGWYRFRSMRTFRPFLDLLPAYYLGLAWCF